MGRLFFFYSFLCFVFVISQCFSSSFEHHLCSPTEASALLQFKQSFEISEYVRCWGSGYPKTTSWNESRDCCTWDGITCDMSTRHVIGLDLSCSLLNGTIHPNSSLFQLHHLHTLNLANNDFYSSSIPHNIGRLTNLRHLNLSYSYLYGKIPTEMSYLSNLVSLDLSSSYVNGLQLNQRTFETMLQNFTNLEVLSLPFVNISSPIPVNISSSLRYVNLQNTGLQGVLTDSFFRLPNLETLKLGNTLLDISYAGFSSELPDSIGTLSSLNSLHLEALDLSWNRLTGKIPHVLTKIKFLAVLNLSQNLLIGPIPQGLQFNTFENDSYGGNLDLCGPPLSKKCVTNDSSHVPQPLESEEDEDESYFFSGFTWESVVIGYSFGLVVGTVVWSFMFKYRKPKLFVEFVDGIMLHKRRRLKKTAQR